ncbi:MAG: type I-C CRISPR-associated endonuclease Cas1c [Oscillospiraceae bacterium]|nr:type I-C CRISPR-associated endonuclease Cas1c [Oscillospiraceae bacterium]
MRKLLNTLFVLSEDSYLALEGETVLILCGEEKRGQFPLHTLQSILSFSYKGASPALMGACGARGIDLAFLSPRGRFLARVSGEDRGNVLLRKTQYRVSDDENQSCRLARSFIFGKLYNCRWSLERTVRDYPLRVDAEALKRACTSLKETLAPVLETEDMEMLRGLEGKAATAYFSVFNELILNQKETFSFTARTRRPPLDPLNALLSFAYSLLAGDCAAAAESAGLDAYVGFLHRDRPGRASLALDLMEELRGVLADRFVVGLINQKTITGRHFTKSENGAVLLNDEGRKLFLTAWQNRKREELTHPYIKEKMPWGLVPYLQALLLARYLRGDLDGYPPCLWK